RFSWKQARAVAPPAVPESVPTSERRSARLASRWACRRRANAARVVCQYNHLRSDPDATVEIDDVGVLQPDASARNVLADRARIIGAVDVIFGIAEIKRARAQRISGTAADPARQIGLTRHHLRRRN